MSLHYIAFLLAFLVAGIALDAAFFWRFKNLHDAFYISPKELTYGYFMFPRLFFVGLSALVAALGSYGQPTNAILIIVGSVLFLFFSLYPHFVIFWKSERIK
jgi:hypothetical protein